MLSTIVIKAVRACNLRCPYCYYINEQTSDYGQIISLDTIKNLYGAVADYLASRTYRNEEEQPFSFIWHGGEPLLMGRQRFQLFLDLQAEYFETGQVRNSLQTNGVLIDQNWIDFFKKTKVGVGISLDSSQEAHDKNRVTVKGAGTYLRVLEAIRLFQKNGVPVGVLSVVDGEYDGSQALANLEKLGVEACDFLIPITNNALQDVTGLVQYHEYTKHTKIGDFLVSAFERWTQGAQSQFPVRLFLALIGNAFGHDGNYLPVGSANLAQMIVLETNGDLCLDPDFWQIDRYGLGTYYQLPFNINDTACTLQEVNWHVDKFASSHSLDQIPDACQTCKVRSLCRGAHPVSRFGPDGSFNHRSAYCESMFALSNAVLEYITKRGYVDKLCDEDLKHTLSQVTTENVGYGM